MAIDQSILEQIRTNDPNLTSLYCRDKNIDENDIVTLANALKNNRTLTKLDLWANSIGDVGATALADALKANHTLSTLHLGDNFIGDAGAAALAATLKGNHTLTRLYLQHNSIGEDGAFALADSLKSNHTLAELDFWNNSIGKVGINALSRAFITSENILFVGPATEELEIQCKGNQATAKDLIERVQNNPDDLTPDERKEIKERIPAIVYIGEQDFKLSQEQTLALLAGVGIKPALGPATQRVNEVREAQRQAAIEDPSQGI